jgi:hypothetical protein
MSLASKMDQLQVEKFSACPLKRYDFEKNYFYFINRNCLRCPQRKILYVEPPNQHHACSLGAMEKRTSFIAGTRLRKFDSASRGKAKGLIFLQSCKGLRNHIFSRDDQKNFKVVGSPQVRPKVSFLLHLPLRAITLSSATFSHLGWIQNFAKQNLSKICSAKFHRNMQNYFHFAKLANKIDINPTPGL